MSTEIETFGITAVANEDYILPNSTLEFIGNRRIQTFSIIVIGDSEAEFVEQATIRLRNSEERLLTITDDDGLLHNYAIMKQQQQQQHK